MPDERPADESAALDAALRTLDTYRKGSLAFGEHVRPVRFVVDNEEGRLVFPAMVAMFEALELVMFIPGETDDALQLLLTLDEVDPERSAGVDRWRIHHGEPEDIKWAAAWIDAARLHSFVFDGDAMMRANPLAGAEPGVCKRLNADRAALRRLTLANTRVDVEDPLCVALDPGGIHIRARFDILRINFPERVETAQGAEKAIDALLSG